MRGLWVFRRMLSSTETILWHLIYWHSRNNVGCLVLIIYIYICVCPIFLSKAEVWISEVLKFVDIAWRTHTTKHAGSSHLVWRKHWFYQAVSCENSLEIMCMTQRQAPFPLSSSIALLLWQIHGTTIHGLVIIIIHHHHQLHHWSLPPNVRYHPNESWV